MRISICQTTCTIENEDTHEIIYHVYNNAYAYAHIMQEILTNSQIERYVNGDFTLTISKKKEKAMYAAIEEVKRIYRLDKTK
jgi:hypothetical protein